MTLRDDRANKKDVLLSPYGLKEGLVNSGFNPDLLMKGAEVISKVKTKPMLLQKNVEKVIKILDEVKKEDIDKYQKLISSLTENISALNEKSKMLTNNQQELIKALMKETKVEITMDSVKLGKGILTKVDEIDTGGLKFKTEYQ